VTAIDLDTRKVYSHPGVEVQQADATDLPFGDGVFDHVLCTAAIKHIPDDAKAVKEMLRVVKKHGLVAVSFDFGQKYEEYPGPSTGRRIYDARSVYERLIHPISDRNVLLCGPVNFGRSDWNDWPIKDQAPKVFEKGVNVQVGFVLFRKVGE
jgi:ubiquinone/menaquinone biosynthesis C-methylase UbiE